MTHFSSNTVSSWLPRTQRIDLGMRVSAVNVLRTQPFTVPHLTTMKCGGTSIFRRENYADIFYNALRLRWKVAGRILKTRKDHHCDLLEFLALEENGELLILNLLTEAAACYILDQDGPAFGIFVTVVQDLYTSQWSRWTDVNNRQNVTPDQLVIMHAQNSANQISNCVLALAHASAELRAWAHSTAANYLSRIVSPGHTRFTRDATSTRRDVGKSSVSASMSTLPIGNSLGPETQQQSNRYLLSTLQASGHGVKRKAPSPTHDHSHTHTHPIKKVKAENDASDDRAPNHHTSHPHVSLASLNPDPPSLSELKRCCLDPPQSTGQNIAVTKVGGQGYGHHHRDSGYSVGTAFPKDQGSEDGEVLE